MAALLLLAPLAAMQFTNEVNWTLLDFTLFGGLLAGVGAAFELFVRTPANLTYRVAASVGVVAAFLLIWANLAVGIVGSERNPLNLLFFATIVLGVAGSALARLRPMGMARAMAATAIALLSAFAIAVVAGPDATGAGRVAEFAGIGTFVALFSLSAWLFARSARTR